MFGRSTHALCLAGAACFTQPAAAQESNAPAAVVTIESGRAREFRTIARYAPAAWSHVAWTPIQDGRSNLFTAYTIKPTPNTPVVFVVHRSAGAVPLSISTMRVNSGPVDPRAPQSATFEKSDIPAWCDNQNWLGGFFIEGIGPKPDGPVVIEFRPDRNATTRLLVDPARHTVRAQPALTIAPATLTTLDSTRTAYVTVEHASHAPDAITLLMDVRSRHTNAFSRTSASEMRMNYDARGRNDLREWRIYYLASFPGSRSDTTSSGMAECMGH